MEINSLPSTAVELNTASGDPSNQDQLHVLGDPAERDLGDGDRLSGRRVGHFQGRYRDYPVSMDYRDLTISSSVFGGNSGGPVFDDAGRVVEVLSWRRRRGRNLI